MTEKPIQYARVFGITLIALGVIALVGQFLNLNIGAFLWPFFIIVPGVLLFLFAMTVDGDLGEAFSILSGLVVSVGLLLLYQSVTGHWTSWAYAWALVAPTGAGLGRMLYGKLKGRQALVTQGLALVRIGLAITVVGLIFFELVLNISGFGLGFIGWPVLFIGLGLIFLLRGLLRGRS